MIEWKNVIVVFKLDVCVYMYIWDNWLTDLLIEALKIYGRGWLGMRGQGSR